MIQNKTEIFHIHQTQKSYLFLYHRKSNLILKNDYAISFIFTTLYFKFIWLQHKGIFFLSFQRNWFFYQNKNENAYYYTVQFNKKRNNLSLRKINDM